MNLMVDHGDAGLLILNAFSLNDFVSPRAMVMRLNGGNPENGR
jgi:hypothetical protein